MQYRVISFLVKTGVRLLTSFFCLASAVYANIAHPISEYTNAHALTPQSTLVRKLCVWDLMSNSGDIVNVMQSYALMAKKYNIKLAVIPYTQEKLAVNDFLQGQCDAMLVTGTAVRPFNRFTSTLEAAFAVPDLNNMQQAIQKLSHPSMASYMKTQQYEMAYEVAGFMPFSSLYLFVKDNSIRSSKDLNAKRLSVFDFDPVGPQIARLFGAIAYPADIGNFAQQFNAGITEIAYAPLMTYRGLQLYKGIGNRGGIIRYPLAQLSLQLVINPERFPVGFGQQSREYMSASFKQYQHIVENFYKRIPEESWISLSLEDQQLIEREGELTRQALVKQRIYDVKMINLLKNIRCGANPARQECALIKQ